MRRHTRPFSESDLWTLLVCATAVAVLGVYGLAYLWNIILR